jgi:soluble lytic murein transglycosylase-like protein
MIKTLLRITFYSLPFIAFAANFTEPRAAMVSPAGAPNLAAPAPAVRVTIYKSRGLRPAGAAAAVSLGGAKIIAARTFGLNSATSRTNTQEVKAYVQNQAIERGVDPKLALWIVKHESSFNPRARGDGDASRGLWQISKIYHPEVSDVAAYSVASSTRWSLERIKEGKANEWATYRYCRTLYGDCPY